MTSKGVDLLQQMNKGKKLYEIKITSAKKAKISYLLEKKTIHPLVVKPLMGEYLIKGGTARIGGGWKTEILLIWQQD